MYLCWWNYKAQASPLEASGVQYYAQGQDEDRRAMGSKPKDVYLQE